jgi:hypothetical protein
MAKRFADTDKYKKQFIRNLPAAYKILWDYICLDCNHAGLWHTDFEVAQMRIGNDAQINKEKALELFNQGEERITVINGGSKWFIKPFVDFQYGLPLDLNNRVHASVSSLLSKEGIKGLTSPLQGAKDKDMDKEKKKDSPTIISEAQLNLAISGPVYVPSTLTKFGALKNNPADKHMRDMVMVERVNSWHDNHTKGGFCSFCKAPVANMATCTCDKYTKAFEQFKKGL